MSASICRSNFNNDLPERHLQLKVTYTSLTVGMTLFAASALIFINKSSYLCSADICINNHNNADKLRTSRHSLIPTMLSLTRMALSTVHTSTKAANIASITTKQINAWRHTPPCRVWWCPHKTGTLNQS